FKWMLSLLIGTITSATQNLTKEASKRNICITTQQLTHELSVEIWRLTIVVFVRYLVNYYEELSSSSHLHSLTTDTNRITLIEIIDTPSISVRDTEINMSRMVAVSTTYIIIATAIHILTYFTESNKILLISLYLVGEFVMFNILNSLKYQQRQVFHDFNLSKTKSAGKSCLCASKDKCVRNCEWRKSGLNSSSLCSNFSVLACDNIDTNNIDEDTDEEGQPSSSSIYSRISTFTLSITADGTYKLAIPENVHFYTFFKSNICQNATCEYSIEKQHAFVIQYSKLDTIGGAAIGLYEYFKCQMWSMHINEHFFCNFSHFMQLLPLIWYGKSCRIGRLIETANVIRWNLTVNRFTHLAHGISEGRFLETYFLYTNKYATVMPSFILSAQKSEYYDTTKQWCHVHITQKVEKLELSVISNALPHFKFCKFYVFTNLNRNISRSSIVFYYSSQFQFSNLVSIIKQHFRVDSLPAQDSSTIFFGKSDTLPAIAQKIHRPEYYLGPENCFFNIPKERTTVVTLPNMEVYSHRSFRNGGVDVLRDIRTSLLPRVTIHIVAEIFCTTSGDAIVYVSSPFLRNSEFECNFPFFLPTLLFI
ncbi:hypothetical protein L9F63_009800, partial [Diploptera punctata]